MIRLFKHNGGSCNSIGLHLDLCHSKSGICNKYINVCSISYFYHFYCFVELLVAFIQAYVFTLLSSVFIGLAREKKKRQKRTGC